MARMYIPGPQFAPPGATPKRTAIGRWYYELSDVSEAAKKEGQKFSAIKEALLKIVKEIGSPYGRAREIQQIVQRVWMPAQSAAMEFFGLDRHVLTYEDGLPKFNLKEFYGPFRDAQIRFYAEKTGLPEEKVRTFFWMWDSGSDRKAWRQAFSALLEEDEDIPGHVNRDLVTLAQAVNETTVRFLQDLSLPDEVRCYHVSLSRVPEGLTPRPVLGFPDQFFFALDGKFRGADGLFLTAASVTGQRKTESNFFYRVFFGDLETKFIASLPWTGPGNVESFEVISKYIPEGIYVWIPSQFRISEALPWLCVDERDIPERPSQGATGHLRLPPPPGIFQKAIDPPANTALPDYDFEPIVDISEWDSFVTSPAGILAIHMAIEDLGLPTDNLKSPRPINLHNAQSLRESLEKAKELSAKIVEFTRSQSRKGVVYHVKWSDKRFEPGVSGSPQLWLMYQCEQIRNQEIYQKYGMDEAGHVMWGRSELELVPFLEAPVPIPGTISVYRRLEAQTRRTLSFAEAIAKVGVLWPFYEFRSNVDERNRDLFWFHVLVAGLGDPFLAIPARFRDRTVAALVPVGKVVWVYVSQPATADGSSTLLFAGVQVAREND